MMNVATDGENENGVVSGDPIIGKKNDEDADCSATEADTDLSAWCGNRNR